MLPGENDINRDATIQRFEFTFELVWKLIQEIAKDHNKPIYGPKNCIRFAANIQLVNDPKTWFEYHNQRNQTTHIYNQDMAKKVYQNIKTFYKDVTTLIANIKKYLN